MARAAALAAVSAAAAAAVRGGGAREPLGGAAAAAAAALLRSLSEAGAAAPAAACPSWEGLRCDPCGCGRGGAPAASSSGALPFSAAAVQQQGSRQQQQQLPGWCSGSPWISASTDASSSSTDASDGGSATSSSGGGGSSSSTKSSKSGKAAAAAADPLASALGGGTAAARHLTPREIVGKLDDYIVGQQDAKRAVAVALRNRWRRHQLDAPAAKEVVPRNILMIGPTGCGKTEIARRLARLVDAPFIKVEATKFTELGYVGRDVDDIVKDLAEAAMSLTRTRLKAALAARAEAQAEERILRDLVGEMSDKGIFETFRQLYREGSLDDRTVEINLSPPGGAGGPEASLLQTLERMGMLPPGGRGGRRAPGQRQKMKIRDARQLLVDQEAEKWLSSDLVAREAVRSAQEDGIVFIDEIDKIAVRGGGGTGGSVSSEGVQRDLLPILEGSTVSTKYGNVSTDHVLFIASGAFHQAKPSDMLAELQGRLPVRVELKGLTSADFYRILTEPTNNMIRQQAALLETEGVELVFTDGAVRAVANAAEEANRMLDNIGARRLHTVLERVLADISFSAPEKVAAASSSSDSSGGGGEPATAGGGGEAAGDSGSSSSSSSSSSGSSGSSSGGKELRVRYEVTEADVQAAVGDLLKKVDLSKYML